MRGGLLGLLFIGWSLAFTLLIPAGLFGPYMYAVALVVLGIALTGLVLISTQGWE